jgi:hypothetical protein
MIKRMNFLCLQNQPKNEQKQKKTKKNNKTKQQKTTKKTPKNPTNKQTKIYQANPTCACDTLLW